MDEAHGLEIKRLLGKRFGLLAALALSAVVASGCTHSSDASRSIKLDADSEKAVVVLGTTLDKNSAPSDEGWLERPSALLTHWQQYDPEKMQLIPGESRVMSFHGDALWPEAIVGETAVHVLEVQPGDYALIGASIANTTTTFVPLTGSNLTRHTNVMIPGASGIEMRGPVKAGRNFLFSVRPAQVVYIGHFDFVRSGAGKYKIVDINYSLDEATARAALADYPGISGDMVTLNLALPTETASR